MKINKTKIILVSVVILMVMVSFVTISKVIADEDESEYEEESDFASGLGVVAAALGFLLNAAYVVQKEVRKLGINPPIKASVALKLHIVTNLILGIAGIIHGYVLQGYAGPVEYLLVSFIIITLISGLMLRYSKIKHLKIFARLIHTQRVLSLIILILLGIHIVSIED